MDENSLKGMRMWGQSKISSYCFSVWWESRELGSKGSSRFPCVTTVVDTFSSDRVVFRTPSNINAGAPLLKQPTALTRWLFLQKCSRLSTGFHTRIWLEGFFLFVCLLFFFYLHFLSRLFTNHRTAGEGGGHLFKSSLPLPLGH